jgi:murein DD-endopeptidase MepM/ murein hydrolase activator NlpD
MVRLGAWMGCLGIMAGAGCATTSGARGDPPVAPEAAQDSPPPAALPPTARPPATRAVAPRLARPALPVKKVGPARRGANPLDGALRRFVAVKMSQPHRNAAIMPGEVEQAWHRVLEAVERGAASNPEEGREAEELGVYIRARVALEAEYEQDQRRYRFIPEDLVARWREGVGLVDQRVRLLRDDAGGFALEERLPEDAPLVLRFPVRLVNVSSFYGHRRDPIMRHRSRFHAGIDLAGLEGSLVASAGRGVVAFADWQGANGNHVVIVHPFGYRTHYSHLLRIFVSPGDEVDTGTPLGVMGDTGRSTGSHLHFGVSRQGNFVDPLDVLEVPVTRDGPVPPQS